MPRSRIDSEVVDLPAMVTLNQTSKVPTEAQNLKLPSDLRAELHRVSDETGISISAIAADGIRLRLKQLSRLRTLRRPESDEPDAA